MIMMMTMMMIMIRARMCRRWSSHSKPFRETDDDDGDGEHENHDDDDNIACTDNCLRVRWNCGGYVVHLVR